MSADYYEMLGVEQDAAVDEIRSAYRDKKAAVTGDEKNKDSDESRAEVARLNKAWNVLSDPFQRGRYDSDRASRAESGDDEDEGEADVAPVRRPTKTAAPANGKRMTAAERRAARANLQPTVTLPPGMYFPSVKRRLFAMGIDILVLVVLFVGSQLLVVHLEKANHRAAYDRVSALNKHEIPDANSAASKAKSVANAANAQVTKLTQTKGKDAAETQAAIANAKAKTDAANQAKDTQTKLNNELKDQQKQLAPTQNLVSGLFFVLALLILIVPSLFGGQTLGKRIQRVRVVRVDGSPVGWLDVFRRYVLLVFSAYVLSTFLGPMGALLVVFVATLWTRNPNQQALQDKFAKTLVLTDVEE